MSEESAPIRVGKVHSNACNSSKRWSPRDNQQLIDLYSTGVSIERIAATLGRGVFGTTARVHMLGLKRPRPVRRSGRYEYIHFTKEQNLLMEKEYLKGTSLDLIADMLNVSRRTISYRCEHLPPRRGRATEADIQEIQRKYEAGTRVTDLADEYKLSVRTIRNHLRVFSHKSRLTDDEQEIIEDRLADGCSVPCIARRINRTRETVTGYIKRHDLHNEPLETDKIVDDLLAGGMSLMEISRKLELPRAAIRQAMLRLGRTPS